jgi:hypothetical protein
MRRKAVFKRFHVNSPYKLKEYSRLSVLDRYKDRLHYHFLNGYPRLFNFKPAKK